MGEGEREESGKTAIRPDATGDSQMQGTPASLLTQGQPLTHPTSGHLLRTTPGGWKLLGTSNTLPLMEEGLPKSQGRFPKKSLGKAIANKSTLESGEK